MAGPERCLHRAEHPLVLIVLDGWTGPRQLCLDHQIRYATGYGWSNPIFLYTMVVALFESDLSA